MADASEMESFFIFTEQFFFILYYLSYQHINLVCSFIIGEQTEVFVELSQELL